MEQYDPLQTPDPAEWQALDEQERIDLILEYHQNQNVELPNEILHAASHAIIENQLALDVEPVGETLNRLMNEGLDRHEAIHAIGSVLAGNIFNFMQGNTGSGDINQEYANRLKKLTAKGWREGEF